MSSEIKWPMDGFGPVYGHDAVNEANLTAAGEFASSDRSVVNCANDSMDKMTAAMELIRQDLVAEIGLVKINLVTSFDGMKLELEKYVNSLVSIDDRDLTNGGKDGNGGAMPANKDGDRTNGKQKNICNDLTNITSKVDSAISESVAILSSKIASGLKKILDDFTQEKYLSQALENSPDAVYYDSNQIEVNINEYGVTTGPAVNGNEKVSKRKRKSNEVLSAEICALLKEKDMFMVVRKTNGHAVYRCSKCNRSDVSVVNITDHFRVIHMNVTDNYKCNTCYRSFGYKTSAYSHLRELHKSKNYSSEITILTNVRRMFISVRKDNGHSVYRCTECNRTDVSVANITDHFKVIHMNVAYNYKCNTCQKAFGYRTSAYSHLREVHKSKNYLTEISILTNFGESKAKSETVNNTGRRAVGTKTKRKKVEKTTANNCAAAKGGQTRNNEPMAQAFKSTEPVMNFEVPHGDPLALGRKHCAECYGCQ